AQRARRPRIHARELRDTRPVAVQAGRDRRLLCGRRRRGAGARLLRHRGRRRARRRRLARPRPHPLRQGAAGDRRRRRRGEHDGRPRSDARRRGVRPVRSTRRAGGDRGRAERVLLDADGTAARGEGPARGAGRPLRLALARLRRRRCARGRRGGDRRPHRGGLRAPGRAPGGAPDRRRPAARRAAPAQTGAGGTGMTRVAAAARGAVGDARAAWGPSQTLLAVITAAALLLPLAVRDQLTLTSLASWAYLALAAAGLTFVVGLAGMPSLAQGALLAVDAVVAAVLR